MLLILRETEEGVTLNESDGTGYGLFPDRASALLEAELLDADVLEPEDPGHPDRDPMPKGAEEERAKQADMASYLNQRDWLCLPPGTHLMSDFSDACVLCGGDIQDLPEECDRGYV